jgi:hypothetical protein
MIARWPALRCRRPLVNDAGAGKIALVHLRFEFQTWPGLVPRLRVGLGEHDRALAGIEMPAPDVLADDISAPCARLGQAATALPEWGFQAWPYARGPWRPVMGTTCMLINRTCTDC